MTAGDIGRTATTAVHGALPNSRRNIQVKMKRKRGFGGVPGSAFGGLATNKL